MSQLLPENEDDMFKIDGVTKSNFKKFGQPLLEITQQAAADKAGIISINTDFLQSYIFLKG